MSLEIPLTNGKSVVVDDEDFLELSKHKWCATKNPNGMSYAARRVGGRKANLTLMHRVIAKASPGEFVDHINGNPLDNRKCNLRICNKSENARNSKIKSNNKTGYKGVSVRKKYGDYRSQIMIYGKNIFLGYYKSPTEAALAYDEAAKKYFGEFAKINFGG